MSSAILMAGGDTYQQAMTRLDAELCRAADEFHLTECSAVRVTVAARQPTSDAYGPAAWSVVPADRNTDWQGHSWPFLATVRVQG